MAGQPPDEIASEVKNIHEAVARAREVSFVGRVLLGVSDIELAGEVLDVEGGIAGQVMGGIRVGKSAGEGRGRKVLVKDVYGAGGEIGGVKEIARAIVAQRQPLVHGA